MATQHEILGAGFVDDMTPLAQTEHLTQIERKTQDGVGIKLAGYPQVFIK
ncbi:MAG: hypothetical protein IH623_03470, partial [Verrucomicrobia bacterium]|nr:hypothetical protein [Verrucomicrobiota bacterium]